MAVRAIRIVSRIVFFACALSSLLTCVPYAMLRGISLPVQREWVIFVAALAASGLFTLAVSVAPRSWIAKLCNRDRDDPRLFSAPLKLLAGFAAISYLVALLAYFAPHRWDLNPQLVLTLCPMYFVRMNVDPPAMSVFFLLAPLNAGTYGSLGVIVGYARLRFARRR